MGSRLKRTYVAPHAGAWIETIYLLWRIWPKDAVAPHAGAWIETTCPLTPVSNAFVAPHAGAWIETKD